MATTINSGYANSPKLTANIADHADVYGGRALVFDGVVDYLNCGSDSSIDNIWAGGGTLSAWIYPHSDGESNFGMIANKRAGGNLGWIFHLNDESGGVCDLRFYQYRASSAGDWITTSREVTINAWNHIAISFDSDNTSNNPSIYVNGTLVALTQTGSQSGAITSDASVDMYIGGEAGAYSFDGKMCDFKLFNSVLTEAQVQELYKKPENTPSAVQDNIVAWYPMIEGNPESPQSIVYDHSEKKLGSELSNKDFTGWTLDGSSNWSASSATSLSHTASSAGFASSPFSTVSGKIYKVSITINSGQTGTYKLQLGASSWLFDPTDGNDTWSGNHIFYVSNAGSSSNGFKIYASSSFVGTFTDVSVKEVQMGNHATTNFFGDMSDVLSSTQKTNMDAILESDDNNFDFSDTAGNQVTVLYLIHQLNLIKL
jgi:hypothetical protein